MHYPHARPVWKEMQVLRRLLQQRDMVSLRGTPPSDTSSILLLLRHRRRYIAKVYIDVVIIDIVVNTTPPPHNIVHMMDMKLRRPLTVQLQGTTPVLTASDG
jgi:hypothetical protein